MTRLALPDTPRIPVFLLSENKAMRQVLAQIIAMQISDTYHLIPSDHIAEIIVGLSYFPAHQRVILLVNAQSPETTDKINELTQLMPNLSVILLAADTNSAPMRENKSPSPRAFSQQILSLPLGKNQLAEALHRAHAPQTIQILGNILYDRRLRLLRRRVAPLDSQHLTSKESELLDYLLVEALHHTVSRQELLQNLWQYHPDADSHTVASHIYRLRQKFAQISAFDSPEIQIVIDGTEEGYSIKLPSAEMSRHLLNIELLRFLPKSSPCISICHIPVEGAHCIGCHRSRNEIAQWRSMDEIDQARVLPQLAERRILNQNTAQNPNQIAAKPNQVKA
ncbi:MAG: winged helix-turn-helix domain-containing protein [Alphaproteobacteria bacterium]|nr:winged helix-turn-helix domain-containing protein [Alphaproteobacteria bacterium]